VKLPIATLQTTVARNGGRIDDDRRISDQSRPWAIPGLSEHGLTGV